MVERIEIRRLTTGTVFKLLLLGGLCSVLPFSLLMGLLGLFGAAMVTWNDTPLTGLPALLATPFIAAFVVLAFAGLGGLFLAAGLWLYARFRPLTLHYWRLEKV